MEFLDFDMLTPTGGLPDALGGAQDADKWAKRREYIKAMLEHYLYGARPKDDRKATGAVLSARAEFGGKATREEIRLDIGRGEHFDAYILRPARAGRFPAVVWTYFPRWDKCPIAEELIERGYVLAAFDYNGLMKDDAENPDSPAKRAYPEADWAATAIWGWGFSKVADYLETLEYVDAERLMCTGHSRNGKSALAAGAFDERFSVVAPINSGCGGAGCFRYLGDAAKITQDPLSVESLGRITHVFPHWFSPRLTRFGGQEAPYFVTNEDRLPFDLHFAKALVAPRALITIEGTEDVWSNTYGTHLTRLAAQPVFDLLGAEENNQQIIRNGGHMHAARDWRWTIEFAEAAWARKKP